LTHFFYFSYIISFLKFTIYDRVKYSAEGRPQVGLNFVSFQDHPVRVTFMLKQPGWLGNTNFGGNPDLKFLEVEAAGIFLVPPRDDELRFPGAMLFDVPASV
jgi:hypothetical protein